MTALLQAASEQTLVLNPERGPAGTPLVIAQLCLGSMGGSSRMACRLSNALSRRGHNVHIFSREAVPWELEERVQQHNLLRCDGDSTTPLYWDWTRAEMETFGNLLVTTLTRQRFDLLHYHYAQPFAAIVGWAAQSLGQLMPPAIGTLHGTDLARWLGDGMGLPSIIRELSATCALTTVSQHMGRLASDLHGLLPLPRVIPNFVEDDWPAADPATVASQSNQWPSILHVSNFRAIKDVGLLARIFLAVHERTAVELCLVGDGPELPSLRAILEDSPAAAAVRYLGECAQPGVHFHSATLLLSTSQEESFGLAVLEAMAVGVPVVSTAVGGIPELIEDEVSGLLFEPGDWRQTADRIVALLGAPGRLEALGKAAVNRAECLRESRVIGLYENFYHETLSSREGSPAI